MTKHTLYLIISLIIVTLSGCTSQPRETGEIAWPEITHETKPWTRWWWHGSAVTEKDITAALESYSAAGLGGVEITPIYGVRGTEDQFLEFLSPEWMEKLVYTLNEAKRLGLGVDLANASGWPFGGPWITDEDASKGMYTKTFTLQGGKSLEEKIEYIQNPIVRTQGRKKVTIDELIEPIAANENMQELALDQVRFAKSLPLVALTANKLAEVGFSESVNLIDHVKDGKLNWVAPEGDWMLCAIFQGSHGKMVERAGPGGEGLVIDHFAEQPLRNYLQKVDEASQGYDLSYLRYYFNDSYEVDDAVGDADFTPELFTAFEQLKGYDLRGYLPALLGLDTEDNNSRVLYDFRSVISELLLSQYTEVWQLWAAEQGKGVRNQSHGSPANVLDLYAASDVPEIEGRDVINLKAAASAAHVSGKNLISSESCTWLNEHFETTLGQAKDALDDFLFAGVNHVFYHGTTYSPQDAAWPGWLFYAAVHFTPANSFWSDFAALNSYVTRAQSFLQAGKPANDILLYFPIADYWSDCSHNRRLRHMESHTFFDGTSAKTCGAYLTENGYSWDAISDKQLLRVNYLKDNLVVGGNAYKTIIVPKATYIPLETLEQLFQLASSGATILFQYAIPADVPGLSDLAKAREQMSTLIGKLTFATEGELRVAAYGKGKIAVSHSLSALTAAGNVQNEPMYADGLQCIRRTKADGNFYYLIKNSTEKAFDGWVTLNAKPSSAALYNPMTGDCGYALMSGEQLYLQLKNGESIAVETFRGEYKGELYPYYKKNGEPIFLISDWKVEFVKGGPTLPEPLVVNIHKSWESRGGAYATFSGTATYTTIVDVPLPKADAWLLNLGSVYESATVYVNNKKIGTLIQSPYTVAIPAEQLKQGDELRIEVSNLMANRIIDMDKRGVEWKIFYNTNVNARKRTNAGADGKFTAAHWEPLPSGLVGVVSLTPLSRVKE
ncbi:glycoside hydrolase family 2 protein [Bacteroides sp. 214]|uniref:glycosyl hydrolase n=1 Tax=Bacteroides sp. 214 TaxID=2302935 RepID=UPI0013D19027|nr:glycosyl hydrolase [Bacteroides sp. 214]NDW13352.1 glycoside hydrolase family 2 protein [Bacteroides sp. 214]